jgi:hypothetical protein
MVFLLIVLAVLVTLMEGIPLIHRKKWNELIVLGILIGIALLIGIAKTLGLPTPIEVLGRWLRPVGEMIFKKY